MELPSRYRCEGCGQVLTEEDGQLARDSHKRLHGLVINIGPDLTPRDSRTVTSYRVQARNPEGEWVDMGQVRRTQEEILSMLDELRDLITRTGMTRYSHARILMSEVTYSQLGGEVELC